MRERDDLARQSQITPCKCEIIFSAASALPLLLVSPVLSCKFIQCSSGVSG